MYKASPPSGLVDLHCHLDLSPCPEAEISEVDRLGIKTLTVTTTPRAWPHNKKLVAKANHVRAALGFHPELAIEEKDQIELWKLYAEETRYIGEVGLDGRKQNRHFFNDQVSIFEQILRTCHSMGDKIISVHSAGAVKEVLDLLESTQVLNNCKVILHWFTGNLSTSNRAAGLGCYFSFNSPMLLSNTGQKSLLSLPKGKLLTETDSPFTKVKGRILKPKDVHEIVYLLSSNLGMEYNATLEMVWKNFQSLISIK
jgi:TatD DNase family protein